MVEVEEAGKDSKKVPVTGGAGFTSSHLVNVLMNCGNEVVVFDDFSNGRLEKLAGWVGDSRLRFVKSDLRSFQMFKFYSNYCLLVFRYVFN